VAAPAEIPPQLAALKRQQFRWAKGSVQCLKKLAARVAVSDQPLAVRAMALVHLSSYLVHPLLLLSLLATLPLMLLPDPPLVSLGFVGVLSLAPPLMYALAQITLYPDRWLRHYASLPVLMLLGTGIALSNTRGVAEALLGVNNVFLRTPKFRIEGHHGNWQGGPYALQVDGIVIGELALAAYALAAAVAAWSHGYVHMIPFLMLYVGGFGCVGGLGVWEARSDVARRVQRWLGTLRARRAIISASPGLGGECRRQPSALTYQQPVSQVTQR
jgi:hypothetical protein